MGTKNDSAESPSGWGITLRIVGLILLAAGAWRVFEQPAGIVQGVVLIGTALALFFLSVFDRLKTFTFSVSQLLKLQAETREVVSQARDATNDVRTLAKLMGAEVLKLITGAGRFGGGGGSRESFDRTEKVIDTLKSLGISDDEIKTLRAGTNHWTIIDYSSVISALADAKRTPETNPVWNEFWTKWNSNLDRPSPSVLEKWLSDNGWLDNTIQEWIHDYRHFLDTGEHRRPEFFRNRTETLMALRKPGQ